MVTRTDLQKIAVAILITISCVACSKNEFLEIDNESQSIVDFSIIDQEFMGMLPGIYQHLSNTSAAGGRPNSAVTCEQFNFVGGDSASFSKPATYTLNVSKTSCSVNDGITRSGEFHVRLSDKFRVPGTTVVIKLKHYLAANKAFTCDSIVAEYIGQAANHESYSVKVVNGTCRYEGMTISYNCTRNLAIYAKTTTVNGRSSNYGSASGVNRTGLSYDVQIKKDLMKENNCPYYSAGELEIVPQGFKARMVNFGQGECDDQANFTVNENTVAFKLK